jgi:uncharacterized membrane protein
MDDFDLSLGLTDTEKKSVTSSEKSEALDDPATQQEIEEGKLPAMLGYVPFLFFVPLFGARNNDFAVRHGKQAFALFVIEVLALLFLIDVVSEFFWTLVFVACLGVALVSCANAAQGKFWQVPYLSEIMKKYDFFRGH